MRETAGIVIVCLALTGCASALHDPVSIDELAAGESFTEIGFDELMTRAQAGYERRTPQAVREASGLWLEAARREPHTVVPLVGAVRALAWLVHHESDRETRRRDAETAVLTGQLCRDRAPEDPVCIYWLAVAVGVQARERKSTGLDALPLMVEMLEKVIEANAALDHGGPHRVLAWVLLRAPGWPRGPGDPDLGFEHALRAVELDPDHPPNQLCLAEAALEVEDPRRAGEAYRKAAELARSAVTAGVPDAAEWLAEAERGAAGD